MTEKEKIDFAIRAVEQKRDADASIASVLAFCTPASIRHEQAARIAETLAWLCEMKVRAI